MKQSESTEEWTEILKNNEGNHAAMQYTKTKY